MNSLKISKGKSEVGNRKISLLFQILAMKTYFVEISDGILEITIYQLNNACIAVLNLSLCFHSSLSSCQFPYFFPINRFKNCFFQSVLTNSILFKKVLFFNRHKVLKLQVNSFRLLFFVVVVVAFLFFVLLSLFIPCLQ
jgi:hypothetical protein